MTCKASRDSHRDRRHGRTRCPRNASTRTRVSPERDAFASRRLAARSTITALVFIPSTCARLMSLHAFRPGTAAVVTMRSAARMCRVTASATLAFSAVGQLPRVAALAARIEAGLDELASNERPPAPSCWAARHSLGPRGRTGERSRAPASRRRPAPSPAPSRVGASPRPSSCAAGCAPDASHRGARRNSRRASPGSKARPSPARG